MPDNNSLLGLLGAFADGSAYKQHALPTAMQVVANAGLQQGHYDSSIGTFVPPGLSVPQNMHQAASHPSGLPWFYDMVHSGGPWDYKQQDPDPKKYENAGNFNFLNHCWIALRARINSGVAHPNRGGETPLVRRHMATIPVISGR